MLTESHISCSFPARIRCPTRTESVSVPTSNRPELPASHCTWNFRLSGAAIRSTRVLLGFLQYGSSGRCLIWYEAQGQAVRCYPSQAHSHRLDVTAHFLVSRLRTTLAFSRGFHS